MKARLQYILNQKTLWGLNNRAKVGYACCVTGWWTLVADYSGYNAAECQQDQCATIDYVSL